MFKKNSTYICLKKATFVKENYKIVPIRYEDRFEIMKWRNEQIYHLRQSKPLNYEDQEHYFINIVAGLFELEKPTQILFSFLKDEICIGYGGLVHINWIDKNAEISFVMDTELQKNSFAKYWSIYLELIEEVAFNELDIYKIYTYAFDLRPHLYEVLETNGFNKDAVLKKHCFFNDKFIDVVIHSKFKVISENKSCQELYLREAINDDAQLLFEWANDKNVRKNAINQEPILWDNHLSWFLNKINSTESKILILSDGNNSFGQIRIDKIDSYWQIDYSLDDKYRGQGLGKKMIDLLLQKFDLFKFKATVKNHNVASIAVFIKSGFKKLSTDDPDFIFFEY
ncbi:GNAT family N-acetyltransferase [Flavobacterium sp.]|uniref:GNAT family N-acetyltransferase n=1 Tax=Flavobacterium sp. TaxID=239 RepID=UPI0031D39988